MQAKLKSRNRKKQLVTAVKERKTDGEGEREGERGGIEKCRMSEKEKDEEKTL